MLAKFASDKAVDRLIIMADGHIVYQGKPSEIPTETKAKLGDGYALDNSAAESTSKEKLDAEVDQRQGTINGLVSMLQQDSAKASLASAHLHDFMEQCRQELPALSTYVMAELARTTDVKPNDDEGTSPKLPKLSSVEWEHFVEMFAMLRQKMIQLDPQTVPSASSTAKPSKSGAAKVGVLRAVFDYCLRMKLYIVGSIVGTVLTQAAALILFGWNEKWAHDTFRLGFRKNYCIAIGLTAFAQASRLFKGITGALQSEHDAPQNLIHAEVSTHFV
eukprot:SAG31_NODE_467_length_15267_cov_13.792919_7_plen_275_part_00